ncbi:ornithine decarboxylase [Shimwellia blattae]|uniref:ornithine decarboxylase n=1 Tax=Shimwellia blattae (strain ATCC 29907 / DSM 4481 / JCM 1650 / NBRC 105725 / CDC 9005-74) TaxID=630626 RepID=I2B5G6_SHIBC|nr:ornithine decarboxylase [Shimwellia blattae]AFJ45770.1 ornithine decarboxylase [Shimwellia blattae DSM 4481 = NBRC 105725]GAB82900.1 ornithine decarboxylase [Shimwellia blattae DSM 4481 = NBRC 105725]VDY63251.1 Ornithine decarboxylase, constitutive [Shimwellia blattae]VEC20962.1 Ornithine decarboxylase, constitutive [Shimwellia blattae]
MNALNIAASSDLLTRLVTSRTVVALDDTDFTDVAAVVLTPADARGAILALLARSGFDLPVFLFTDQANTLPEGVLAALSDTEQDAARLEAAASDYEARLLPPFFSTLSKYVAMGNSTFACPGHQHGAFFKKHPAGRQFFEFFGENLFRADMCNADVRLGDLLIHEGSAKQAQKNAARVFNADKTYFVLNGTSAANKVVTNALLTPGDLVLFDRNNHKSNHHGALIQAGATPVYLETARNPFGFIGGIDAHCFNEDYLRRQIASVAPERAAQPRPFRLAVIQLGTYDGTVYSARQVVDTIGHLCDYILFDSAWVGYEQFIPLMADCSPLLLDLKPEDPGIFVTQSVHKQQAGFSQTSQIHKKDNHIRGQARFCLHKRLNNAFMLHASTSPFYPLFAALDINARIHDGEGGRRLWQECVALGIEARKAIFAHCRLLRPFVPPRVEGRPWQDYPTRQVAGDRRFFSFDPADNWHGFEGYEKDEYLVDPCKLLLTTPGIDAQTGQYTEFGVPAAILAHYLRENGVIPEKADLNSILFLLTPAESPEKMAHLVALLVRFEQHIEQDTPLAEVLPSVVSQHPLRYQGYTLRRLCQEMHALYVRCDIKALQKAMFRQSGLPAVAQSAQQAHIRYIRGEAELVRLSEARGRIAAEGALPYPPGVLCVVPGEVWDGAALRYFLALEEGINLLPGFSPELQGVYSETGADGRTRLYGYMLPG